MLNSEKCPVCEENLVNAYYDDEHKRTTCICNFCGKFRFSGLINSGSFYDKLESLTTIQRVSISHKLKNLPRNEDAVYLSVEKLEEMINFPELPSVSVQTKNVIQYIGNEYNTRGVSLDEFPKNFYFLIGAPSIIATIDLLKQLQVNDLITYKGVFDTGYCATDIKLTLSGWESFESFKHSDSKNKIGFLAMQYGEDELEKIVREHIKPRIEAELGFKLYDMRDIAKAGVIDDIMRNQIRDSAFILADLTHENSGAYWEAGYAEGLGKPVIYLCEQKKFDEVKTHFDTNHSTTVPWSIGEESKFCDKLVATIRRSLDL